MRRLSQYLLVAVMALLIVAAASAQSATVSVDPERATGEIDPTIFSLVNFQELVDRAESVAVLAVERLNLGGTMQRLATSPPAFMPEPGVISEEDLFASESRRYLGVELVERVRESGMEPVLLLAYNLPWLSPDGNVTRPPTDPDAWAEFAAQAVTSLNGEYGSAGYQLNVKYVEIWNEPDTPIYWQGSGPEYHEQFRRAATAIKRAHPDVLVGGPASLNYTGPWTRAFIRECADVVDFLIYHSYNEPVDQLTTRIRQMAEFFRSETGNLDAQVMITETDNFGLNGAEKVDYLMRRQFALQDVSEYIEGLHHFQAKAYSEGASQFGLVHLNGNIVSQNYWPYWIMRDLRGSMVSTSTSGSVGGLLAMTGRTENTVSTVVYEPLDGSRRTVTVRMQVPAEYRDGMLLISSIGGEENGIVEARPVDGASSLTERLQLAPGQAYALTVRREAADDITWATIEFSEDRALVGEPLEATISVRNITTEPIRGVAQVLGVPQEWDIDAIDGSDRFSDLEPGDVHVARFTIGTAAATPEEGAGAFAFISARPPRARSIRMSSLATNVLVEAPVSFLTKPELVYTTPGYEAEFRVYLTNTYSEAIAGTASLQLPDGAIGGDPREVTIPRGETQLVTFDLGAESGMERKTYPITAVFDFRGNAFTFDAELIVTDFPTGLESTIVDLDPYLNVDGASSMENFDDFDQDGFGGRFALAAQFMPDEGENRYLGVRFDLPSVADGDLNLVETRGQTIDVPAGRYDWLYLLTTTVNSSKGDEALEVSYADGTETVPFQVTDWCVAPKFGEIPIMRAAYRHITLGVLKDASPQIFLIKLPLDSGRDIQSITLPNTPTLYMVSMTLVRE